MGDRITFVGHASVLIEIGGRRLLTDPLLRDRFLIVQRQVPLPSADNSRRLDAVLISHLHPDHLDFRSLRAIEGKPRLIAPAGADRLFARRGLELTDGVAVGDSVELGPVEVTATRATHDGRRYPVGRTAHAVGYLVESAERGVYFAGDTDLFGEMSELAGRVDVALLPIGGWGPKVRTGHLDPRRAAEAAAIIRPRVVVPVHWGTYLRADLMRRRPELLDRYPRELAEHLAREAPGVELQVLAPGGSLELSSTALSSAP